jgi:hypothetical protein
MGVGFALLLVVALAACNSNQAEGPPPPCPLPDGGERCSCPGTSVQPFGCAQPFTCLEDGTWAPYDASCLTIASEAGDATGQINSD